MKMRWIFALIMFLAGAIAAAQSEGEAVLLTFIVSNNHGQTATLLAGVHEFGSNGLDPLLNEQELPPVPPSEIFDTRFVGPTSAVALGEGTLLDLRPLPAPGQPVTQQYRITFQAGRSWPSVTLHIPASLPAAVRQLRVDGRTVRAGDSVVSLLPSGDMNLGIDFVVDEITFTMNPSVLTFTMNSRDTALPMPKTVRITPSVAGVSWYAMATESWMGVNPRAGNGEMDVQVSITTLALGDGRNTGEILLKHSSHDEPGLITVHVDYVTSAGETPAPGVFNIGYAYPNPASVATPVCFPVTGDLRAGLDMSVHDALGRCHRSMRVEAGELCSGLITWDARDQRGHAVAPGLYLSRFVSRGHVRIQTVLVK